MTKRRLVVLGMMGRCPFGGQTWLYLNWLRGLHRSATTSGTSRTTRLALRSGANSIDG